MNKTLIAATVAGIVLLASNAQAQTVPEGYQLQQVLMMSRHNLRAPLANNGSVLEQSDRKSTRLNSSHLRSSRMPSSA